MRVLLTTSPAPRRSPFFTTEKRFPLGLGFLISVLKQAGHEVFFIDNYLQPRQFWLDGYLQENRIELVGIYSSTICYEGTKEIIRGCDRLRRSGRWQGKIAVGGPHTSVTPLPLPEAVDYVVKGEGEMALLDIVHQRTKPGTVTGEVVTDLDALPRPAYDIFWHYRPAYQTSVDCFPEAPVFTMNTSRGCPFSCRFCSVAGVWGKSYRSFSAERIVEDIQWLMKDFGIKGVYFREDNFTFSRKRLLTYCELLLRRGINVKWMCESRVRPMSRETLEVMARAGCRWIYFGCESGSQRVLDLINKGITVEDIRNVLTWCSELGIKGYTSWIAGVPGETEQDRNMTLRLIEELNPYSVGFNVFVGLPGSELYEEMLEKGLYYYKDRIGLLYPHTFNELAERFYGQAAEGHYCPKQSFGFRIGRNFRKMRILYHRILGTLVRIARRYVRP